MAEVENVFIKESEGVRLHAFDYAAQWGSTKGNGPLFYNVSVEGYNWSKKEWNRFAEAINENIEMVKASPSDFDSDEIEALTALREWAYRNHDEATA